MVRGAGDRERISPDGLEPGDIVHWMKGTKFEDVDVYVRTDRVDVISIGRSPVIIPMRFDVTARMERGTMTTTKGCKCRPGQIVHWRPGTEEELVDVYISDGPSGIFALFQSLEVMRIWPIVKVENGKYTYDEEW